MMCRILPTTLRGSERVWFFGLRPASMSSFKDLFSMEALEQIDMYVEADKAEEMK